MTATDSKESKQQTLRLQRFYLAQINYLISYSVIVVAWLVGQYDGTLSVSYTHLTLPTIYSV